MRIQNILSAIAITSILFVGCSKEATVEPRNVSDDTEIYEFSTPGNGKETQGDDNDGIIRINSTVVRKSSGNAVVGAEVTLSNASNNLVALTDNNGFAQIDALEEGIYTYTLIENGTIKLLEVVTLNEGIIIREDEID